MKAIFIFLISITLVCNVLGQCCPPTIMEISVIPANPTASDTVKIVTVTGMNANGFSYGHSYTISNDTIFLVGCFSSGTAPSAPIYSDTTIIGVLPSGVYRIIYEANTSFDFLTCIPSYTSTSEITFEVVTGTNSISENANNNLVFLLFPNPTSDLQTLNIRALGNESLSVEILNLQGKQIRNVYSDKAKQNETKINCDVSDLQAGMYFYQIQLGDQHKSVRFVKQ